MSVFSIHTPEYLMHLFTGFFFLVVLSTTDYLSPHSTFFWRYLQHTPPTLPFDSVNTALCALCSLFCGHLLSIYMPQDSFSVFVQLLKLSYQFGSIISLEAKVKKKHYDTNL